MYVSILYCGVNINNIIIVLFMMYLNFRIRSLERLMMFLLCVSFSLIS